MNALQTYAERVVLPRLLDLLAGLLELMEECATNEEVELLILDFCDAYKIIPAHSDERRTLCAKVPGESAASRRVAVYFSLVFGGSSCPDGSCVASSSRKVAAKTRCLVAAAQLETVPANSPNNFARALSTAADDRALGRDGEASLGHARASGDQTFRQLLHHVSPGTPT